MATFCAQSKSNAGRSLSSGHRYRGNRSFESRNNVKGNRFYQMIRRIAEMIGYDARYIAPMFNTYTSADFIYGAQAVPKVATIPDNMWQSVHCHYNLCLQQPFTEQPIVQRPLIFKEKSSVYIGIRVTKRLIKDQTILDQFSTTKRLYQYLNWTLRMCKVTHSMTQFQGQNGANVLLFDVELHDQRKQGLYALCIINDLVTDKSQRWQLADLLTAQQVIDILGINKYALPRGVRVASHQFASYRNVESLKALKAKLSKMEFRRKVPRYTHLKCIQTGICKKNRNDQSLDDTLNVKASDFREAVLSALANEKVDLVPIVSVVSRKPKNRKDKIEDFSVDYLLPVQIGTNWIGIVYRDNESSMVLMDRYDITNKAILCDPTFNALSFEWFQNDCDRLKIVPDEIWTESMNPLEIKCKSPSMSSQESPSLSAMCLVSSVSSVPSVTSVTAMSGDSGSSSPVMNNVVDNQSTQHMDQYAAMKNNGDQHRTPTSSPGSWPQSQLQQAIPSAQLIIERVEMSDEQLVQYFNEVYRVALQNQPVFEGVHQSVMYFKSMYFKRGMECFKQRR